MKINTKLLVLVLLTLVISSAVYFAPRLSKALAASDTWTQTNWVGGIASGTVNSAVTTYSSSSSAVTNVSGQATLGPKSGWMDSDWNYRKKITFDNTNTNLGVTAEALANFQVLVKLDSGSDIDYSKTQDSGQDLRFTDSNGTTELAYEIEEWNESGTSYVWVRVPQIDQNSDTDYIYMYYGNNSAEDNQDAEGVWNEDDYSFVYHFNEEDGTTGAGSVTDSTGNTSGTPSSGIDFEETGQISTTADFSGGTGISLGSLDDTVLTAATTVSYWIYSYNYASPGRQNPFNQAYGGWGTQTLESNATINWYFGSSGRNASPYIGAGSTTIASNGSWIYITSVRNPTGYTYTWYKNGSYLRSSTYSSTYPTISPQVFTIGDGYVNPLNGKLDEFRVHKSARSAAWIAASYKTDTDGFNTLSSEESVYAPEGTVTSNIFDAGYATDWEAVSFNYSGSGTASVKLRSGTSPDLADASSFSSCTAIDSGSEPSTGGCTTDTDRYVQYQVILAPGSGASPVFEDITVTYSASDQTAPTVNASSMTLTSLDSGSWTNTEPTINWTAGEDDPAGNGLTGYCLALNEAIIGSSSSLDPAVTGGILTGLEDNVSEDYCDFIVSGTSLDLSGISGLSLTSDRQYYVSIKAVDLAGNIYSGSAATYQDLASFKYDVTPPDAPAYISLPGDFISSKTVTITWPSSGGDGPSDNESGLAGLQYRIGASGTWYGDTHNGNQDLTDLLTNDGDYTTIEDPDFASIEEGSNFIYFRSVDNLGNVSNVYTTGTLKVNTIAPSAPLNLSVNPATNTANSFAFDWDAPDIYTGQVDNITYCYTFNTLPSITSCNYTAAGVTELTADAYATQPGENTMYVVARDEAENINYDTYSSIEFTANTAAPGIPLNLDIADVSVKATSSWKIALSWEEPADLGAGISTYKIYHSTDGSSYELSSTVTGITHMDTNLAQVTHYYKVKACDSANNCGAQTDAVSLYPDGKFTEAPTLSSDPEVTNITTKSATVSWVTSRTCDSKVQYGTGK